MNVKFLLFFLLGFSTASFVPRASRVLKGRIKTTKSNYRPEVFRNRSKRDTSTEEFHFPLFKILGTSLLISLFFPLPSEMELRKNKYRPDLPIEEKLFLPFDHILNINDSIWTRKKSIRQAFPIMREAYNTEAKVGLIKDTTKAKADLSKMLLEQKLILSKMLLKQKMILSLR